MIEQSNILVVGGTGGLGQELLSTLTHAIGTSRSSGGAQEQMDILDGAQVTDVVERSRPKCVINTAAMTSVDGCERDPEAAQAVHVDGTANLVAACEATGSRLVHFSTNYVFDGSSGPYGEDDAPNPLSVYGRTKLESERLVIEGGCAGVVVRTAVFYGQEHEKPNFVTWALRELILGKPIRVVTDEWANPTYVPDLVSAIKALVEDTEAGGVYHCAGADYFTRYDMVMVLCDVFGLDQSLVTAVVSEELGQVAERPKRAGLKIERIQSVAGDVFGPYLENLKALRSQMKDPLAWVQNRQ